MKNRCQCRNIINKKICKNASFSIINDKRICYMHLSYHFNNYIIRIQTTFRNYKKKRAISIFKNLPRDLQLKIIFHMDEPELIYKHHHKIILKILHKKMILEDLELLPFYSIDGPDILEVNKINRGIGNLISLFIKYYRIIPEHLHEKISWECYNYDKLVLNNYYPNMDMKIFNYLNTQFRSYIMKICNDKKNYPQYEKTFPRLHLYC